MARYRVEDKKAIAKYQRQAVWEETFLGERVLKGYRCKLCKRIFPLDILEVDHIRPLAKRGSLNPSNLQLLCPPCNKKKGAKLKKTAKKMVAKSQTKKAPRSKKGPR